MGDHFLPKINKNKNKWNSPGPLNGTYAGSSMSCRAEAELEFVDDRWDSSSLVFSCFTYLPATYLFYNYFNIVEIYVSLNKYLTLQIYVNTV